MRQPDVFETHYAVWDRGLGHWICTRGTAVVFPEIMSYAVACSVRNQFNKGGSRRAVIKRLRLW